MKCFADCSAAILIQGVIIRNGNYALGATQAQTSPNSCLKGRGAERRGLSSVAPRDHPEIRGTFAPFAAGEGGGQSSSSGLSLALLAFVLGPRFPLGNCPRDGGISFCSFCSVLPMESQ